MDLNLKIESLKIYINESKGQEYNKKEEIKLKNKKTVTQNLCGNPQQIRGKKMHACLLRSCLVESFSLQPQRTRFESQH
jgi:hypothetical protein